MASQITIDLRWRTDRNGMKYLVGGTDMPCSLDLSNGISFIIWPHDEDSEDYPQMAIRKREFRKKRRYNDNENDDGYDDQEE